MCDIGFGEAASDQTVTTQGDFWTTPRPNVSVASTSTIRIGVHQLKAVRACLPMGPPTAELADRAAGSASVGATTSASARS